jgi:prolyl-tRNA synthetase
MRGREFIMKDAYSFHADESCLRETYAQMDGAYRRIFERCGLRAVAVEADSGAIGGSASQEFMVTAESGEDLILSSPDGRYGANQERAVSLPAEALPLPGGLRDGGRGDTLATPGQTTIDQLCQAHGFAPSQLVKVLLLLARFEDGWMQPLLVALRGDQELNEVKLANTLTSRLGAAHGALLGVEPLTAELLRQQRLDLDLGALPLGYLGPDLPDALLAATAAAGPGAPASQATTTLERRFLRLIDPTAAALEAFVCGANQADAHRVGAGWAGLGLAAAAAEPVDLRAALPGDRCLHDPSQRLEAARGIEVGHIFQLGRKYSEALEARFTTDAGVDEPLWMGCYGIGVSRLAQAAVEQNHDGAGIRWPVAIAPFELLIVIASAQDPTQVALAETLYERLGQAGLEVLLDDREERAGVKFKDADLIGIPWRLVVGRGAADGRVELVERASGERLELPLAEAEAELMAAIPRQRRGRTAD